MPQPAATEDRRVRKTKTALRRAIVELSLEKGFQSVTGEDIADRADVTRASFYKHYENKEHLLADVVDDFSTTVLAASGTPDTAPPYRSRIIDLVQHARTRRDVVRLIIQGAGDGVALRRFTSSLELLILDDIETGRITPADADADAALMAKMRAAQIVAGVGYALDSDEDDEHIASSIITIIDCGWRRTRSVGVAQLRPGASSAYSRNYR